MNLPKKNFKRFPRAFSRGVHFRWGKNIQTFIDLFIELSVTSIEWSLKGVVLNLVDVCLYRLLLSFVYVVRVWFYEDHEGNSINNSKKKSIECSLMQLALAFTQLLNYFIKLCTVTLIDVH